MSAHSVACSHCMCLGHCLFEHIWLLGILGTCGSLILWVWTNNYPVTPLNSSEAEKTAIFFNGLLEPQKLCPYFYPGGFKRSEQRFLPPPFSPSFSTFLTFVSSFHCYWGNYINIQQLGHLYTDDTLKFSFISKKYLNRHIFIDGESESFKGKNDMTKRFTNIHWILCKIIYFVLNYKSYYTY